MEAARVIGMEIGPVLSLLNASNLVSQSFMSGRVTRGAKCQREDTDPQPRLHSTIEHRSSLLFAFEEGISLLTIYLWSQSGRSRNFPALLCSATPNHPNYGTMQRCPDECASKSQSVNVMMRKKPYAKMRFCFFFTFFGLEMWVYVYQVLSR